MVSRRHAFGFAEIMIAVLVCTVAAYPIITMVTATRTETTKAINYLRALELANEIIDLANVVPFHLLQSFAGVYSKSLKPLPIREPQGDFVVQFQPTQIEYSPDYGKCFYYRDITIESVPGVEHGRFLQKLRVSVEWNEGKPPQNEEDNTGPNQRMRKVVLETLLFNDLEPMY
jgi:hypothetical protein